MDPISLLSMIENELVDSKGYFRRKINGDRCMQLLQELKNSFPDCIVEAQKIVDNKQRILQNADFVAKNTISTAENKAKRLAAGSEIEQIAQNEAKQIMNKASLQREVLIDKTKEHLDGMFDEAERFALSLLNMIRKNRQELKAIEFN